MHRVLTILTLAAVLGLTGARSAPAAPARGSAALMGARNELTDTGLTVTFTSSSVKPYQRNGCVVGAFQNFTGKVLTEVVVSTGTEAGYAGQPPRIAGGSLGDAPIPASDFDNRAHVKLDRELHPGEGLRLRIDLDAPRIDAGEEASVFVVKLEPGRGR